MILPNQLTVLRIILSPIFLILFLSEDVFMKQLAFVVFVIASLTDWYDGWLARKFNYITEWGKFLDPTADKILTSCAFIGFVIIGVLELWMVIIIIVRDFLMTGLRIYADYKNYSFKTSTLAKWKTFFQMAFLDYLLLIFTLMTFQSLYKNNIEIFNILTNKNFIYITMLSITLFTLITGIFYLYQNRHLIKGLFTSENK
ncbi:MAG: CDP-diacylglycerol--glycerol-3-phosphate 3-phosphatidyltransferase [Ignavibacteriales bacterium]|nr:CDP-diacylglycerol--glycerol-3-phosphate 3-phosphatidyltransferase [Ignavibacteriales bacterium]